MATEKKTKDVVPPETLSIEKPCPNCGAEANETCRNLLPWQPGENGVYHQIADAEGRHVAFISMSERSAEIRDQIIRAVNAHDALVAALKALEPYLSNEAQMLDYASLNEGRASGFDVASIKAREALALAEANQ